jgi:hypothetical protein
MATASDLPVITFFLRRMEKPGVPGEGSGNGTSVFKVYGKNILC